jgi:hypothetical protein
MTELEQALADLGGRLDYPRTPQLAPAVRARLVAPPARRPLWQRRLVLALAVLVVALGAAFAVPQARTAILEFFGLQGATVERVVLLPEVPPAGDLALGERFGLAEARKRVSFPVLVPELLGAPEQVYVADDVPGGRVSLVYLHNAKIPTQTEEGIGLLLTEFRGDLAPELIGKMVAAGTEIEELSVDGAPGLWISGEPHFFLYRDEQGEIREETIRLVGNTLLFERDNLLVRIEAALSKEEALEIAASLR